MIISTMRPYLANDLFKVESMDMKIKTCLTSGKIFLKICVLTFTFLIKTCLTSSENGGFVYFLIYVHKINVFLRFR